MFELGRAAEQRRYRGVERGRQHDDGRVPARTALLQGVVLFECAPASPSRSAVPGSMPSSSAGPRRAIGARATRRPSSPSGRARASAGRRAAPGEAQFATACSGSGTSSPGLPQCEEQCVEAGLRSRCGAAPRVPRRVRAALDLFETLVGCAVPRRQRVVERGDHGHPGRPARATCGPRTRCRRTGTRREWARSTGST